ncbi:MAG: hypothetical protein C4291_02915 [Candidatus Dadabacteria bacterium]
MITVLIADENDNIRESISLRLSNCTGYRVVTASNGADAILKAKEIKPDIVFADISLSDKNGYELSREITGKRSFWHDSLEESFYCTNPKFSRGK